jgi:hypothetical protein
MLISIGLATEPSHYASKGISQKAFNALDPSRATNERDKLAREATFRKVQSRLIHGVSTISKGTIPNLARREDQKIQYQYGLFIPADHITMLCHKFVKGITWLTNKDLIDDEKYTITASPISPHNKLLQEAINWPDYSRPPGLIIKRIHYKEDPTTAMYVFIIWKQYLFYAYCRKNDISFLSNI